MEKLLSCLFDYQKFEPCGVLQGIIDSVHMRYGSTALDVDDLEWVSAAGDLSQKAKNTKSDTIR